MKTNRNQEASQDCFEAWLMGTKGENAEEFEKLVVEAVRDTAYWRRHVFPMDPRHITEAMKESLEYKRSVVKLRQEFQSLLSYLKHSVPAFSMRYQAHMGWDLLLPGMLGHFAGMLHGSNNIAFEGAPATAVLESMAAQDLCQMIGFRPEGLIRPWAHLTGGGTLSNIEGLWAARNIRFLGLAARNALKSLEREIHEGGEVDLLESVADAWRVEVTCHRAGDASPRSVPLLELSAWELCNLPMDEVLALPERISAVFDADPGVHVRDRFESALIGEDVNSKGVHAVINAAAGEPDGIGGMPVVIAAGTRHFSIEKAACLLGLGQENILTVFVDEDARMDVKHLEELLRSCLDRRIPVLAVVATMGTTEEGAVDPIADILESRGRFRISGLDFALHVDAAWGGYHASMMRDDFPMGRLFPDRSAGPTPASSSGGGMDGKEPATPSLGLSAYVRLQYDALPEADTVTVDPHKQGHMPFPAGAICYRNSALRNLVKFSAPYLGEMVPQAIRQADGATDPFMGIYGVEGSRPGAAAASVFLTHRLIRPSRGGFGRLIGMEMFNCKKVFALISRLNSDEEDWIAVTASGGNAASPAEMASGAEGLRERWTRIETAGNREIGKDGELLASMEQMGPDLNILCYLFNFRVGKRFNQDLGLLAAFNQAIYEKIRLRPDKEYAEHKLIVSQTVLLGGKYGPRFLNGMLTRLGLALKANSVNCAHINLFALRSTVANPWLTDTVEGSFLPHIRKELLTAVRQGLAEVRLIGALMDELKRERSPLLKNPMLPVKLVGFAPDLIKEKLPEGFVHAGLNGSRESGLGPCTDLILGLLRHGGAAEREDQRETALKRFNEAGA